jgi:thiamine pyrophosphokinase
MASSIICADGGANRLYDMMELNGKESNDVRYLFYKIYIAVSLNCKICREFIFQPNLAVLHLSSKI